MRQNAKELRAIGKELIISLRGVIASEEGMAPERVGLERILFFHRKH